MKKVIYSLAVLFSVALVSCGGNKAAEATDSETIATESIEAQVVDTTMTDTATDTTLPTEAVEGATDTAKN